MATRSTTDGRVVCSTQTAIYPRYRELHSSAHPPAWSSISPRAVCNGTQAPVTGSQGGILIPPRVVIPRGGKSVQSTVDRAGLW